MLASDMKDGMIESLRNDIATLKLALQKEGVQLMDRARHAEELQRKVDTADDTLLKLQIELLLKNGALDNVRHSIQQSGIQFSEQIGALEKQLSQVQGKFEESSAKNI